MLKIIGEKVHTLGLGDRICCMQASAETMDFSPGQFDIIAATVSLHHVKEREPVIRKIQRSLTDGGRFVLGEIDMDTTGRLEDKKRLLRILDYLRDELVLAMEAGGVPAFGRMYSNGKKHILNDGEFLPWLYTVENCAGMPVQEGGDQPGERVRTVQGYSLP